MLASIRLQHSSEEAVGKGEAGEPEQDGGLGRLCPARKLIDSLAKIPGPRCQGLQRGVCLDRERERERWQIYSHFMLPAVGSYRQYDGKKPRAVQ